MMKKYLIIFLTIASFAISFYFTGVSLEESLFGPGIILLWMLPFTMILVNSSLLILPYVLKDQHHFTRFQKGFDTIFLALSIILLSLHVGMLLAASGNEVNLLIFVPFSAGIVLITTANTLPRFKVEVDTTSSHLSQASTETWNRLIRPCSYPLTIGGFSMLLCVFLPDSIMMITFFAILLITLLVVGMKSYKALAINN